MLAAIYLTGRDCQSNFHSCVAGRGSNRGVLRRSLSGRAAARSNNEPDRANVRQDPEEASVTVERGSVSRSTAASKSRRRLRTVWLGQALVAGAGLSVILSATLAWYATAFGLVICIGCAFALRRQTMAGQ